MADLLVVQMVDLWGMRKVLSWEVTTVAQTAP